MSRRQVKCGISIHTRFLRVPLPFFLQRSSRPGALLRLTLVPSLTFCMRTSVEVLCIRRNKLAQQRYVGRRWEGVGGRRGKIRGPQVPQYSFLLALGLSRTLFHGTSLCDVQSHVSKPLRWQMIHWLNTVLSVLKRVDMSKTSKVMCLCVEDVSVVVCRMGRIVAKRNRFLVCCQAGGSSFDLKGSQCGYACMV